MWPPLLSPLYLPLPIILTPFTAALALFRLNARSFFVLFNTTFDGIAAFPMTTIGAEKVYATCGV